MTKTHTTTFEPNVDQTREVMVVRPTKEVMGSFRNFIVRDDDGQHKISLGNGDRVIGGKFHPEPGDIIEVRGCFNEGRKWLTDGWDWI